MHKRISVKILFIVNILMVVCGYSSAFEKHGEEYQSLNGIWTFQIDADSTGINSGWTKANFEDRDWDSLKVPGNWDTENEFAHYIGKAFYRKSFAVPGNWQGTTVRLKFDAVYETAEVWLNDEYLGKHVGGYTPFEFNVSDKLIYDRENVLVVSADNSYNRGAWWQWGGMSRDVTLIRNNALRIVRTKIQSEPYLEKGKVEFRITHEIENNDTERRDLKIIFEIVDQNKRNVLSGSETDGFFRKSTDIAPGERKIIETELQLDLDHFKLWHFDDPNLYFVQSQLVDPESDKILHKTSDRFGIRKVEVSETALLINGEPVRLNGFNRVHDHRIFGNTEPAAFVKDDIIKMKALGGVFSRIMHAPQATSLLDVCDELGYLIIEEIPVWGMGDPQTFPDNPLTKQWLKEMIDRDFNHPCIIGWSVANEIANPNARDYTERIMTSGQYNYIKTMLDYIESELDSSRLSAYVSFSAFRDGATPDNEPMAYADIININCYGDAPQQIRAVHEKWPDKPIFVSEYGKGQIGLDPNTAMLKPEVSAYMDSIRTMDYVIGTALWTYNDYRSRYRGTPPSENRAWGVYNVWRQPKRAAKQIHNQYAPVRDMKLDYQDENILVTIIPRNQKDIPSFILRDYCLQVHLVKKDNTQRLIAKKNIVELKPGEQKRTYEFSLSHVSENDAYLKVSLISGTGIEVYIADKDLAIPDIPDIKELIPAKNTVRVVFGKVTGADTYKAWYGKDKPDQQSDETINHFIDLNGLEPDTEYRIAVVGINKKGESKRNQQVKTRTTSGLLPPVIWATVPVEGGFYIGYSVEGDDRSFDIEYGTVPDQYSETIADIKLKGAYKVDNLKTGETYYYRIRRKTDEDVSNWSEQVSVSIPNN